MQLRVAALLGMTLADLRRRMTVGEFQLWVSYLHDPRIANA